jgi:hypothetical protein
MDTYTATITTTLAFLRISYDFGVGVGIGNILVKDGCMLFIGFLSAILNKKFIDYISSGAKGPMGPIIMAFFGWGIGVSGSVIFLLLSRGLMDKII